MVYVLIATHIACFFGGYALCLNRAKAKAEAASAISAGASKVASSLHQNNPN